MVDGEVTIRIESSEREESPACHISYVDERIREFNLSGYEPDRVSIGPFHRKKKSCQWMEQVKQDLVCSALSIDHLHGREKVWPYLEKLARHENRARQHYNRFFSRMTSDDFVFMLLLDGYFVLSHFGLVRTEEGWERTETVSNEYDRDVIFLLENQVPFFILEEIYKLLDPGTDEPDSSTVPRNCSNVFQTIAERIETLVYEDNYVDRTVKLMNTGDKHPCHLVHLLYKYFQHDSLNSEDKASDVPPRRWRSATSYHAAGIRFAMRKLDSKEARSILDVKLENGTLQIPRLVLHINTLTMLRNMVALEQHSRSIDSSHIATYCLFMAQLANTEEDVRLLSNKGIIVHFLCRDKDVADGFAELCKGVFINVRNPKYNYLIRIVGDLDKLCQSRLRTSMAWLRHNKCNNILMALAVVAGIIIFICTVEQSLFAALSYAMKNT